MARVSGLAFVLAFLALPATGADITRIPYPGYRGETVDHVIVPAGSPVRFSKMDREDGAHFTGQFSLSGTYYYGDGEFNDGPTFMGVATIVPDRDIVARLPHLAERKNSKFVIYIGNPESFADTVISKSVLARVRRKNGGSASGHIAIKVDRYRVEISCDGASYWARFRSVVTPVTARVVTSPSFGC
jgi:hypothetical protein